MIREMLAVLHMLWMFIANFFKQLGAVLRVKVADGSNSDLPYFPLQVCFYLNTGHR
jgi:hypothetical protein